MTTRMRSSLIGQILLVVLAMGLHSGASSHEQLGHEHSKKARAMPTMALYIANAGVMISDKNSKIVFDPLFNNTYGQYQAVPERTRDALLNGKAPFDDIDAIMISHHHGDHFDAQDMLTLIRNCERVKVYAPLQAFDAMKSVATEADAQLFERVTPLNINHKDAPQTINIENLVIEVAHIPHAGWPSRHKNVQNLSYRVTLNDRVTVTHMGDADINQVHYSDDEKYWSSRQTDVAFPPYWYLQSKQGRQILSDQVRAKTSVGVHVPESISNKSSERPPEYRDIDLFTTPGETREIRTQE